jgi:hypothetical protein
VGIDSRIAPIDGEFVLVKKRASSFSGTSVSGRNNYAKPVTVIVQRREGAPEQVRPFCVDD